jgi:hypothetical protein
LKGAILKTIRLPANSEFIRFDSDVGRLLAIAEYPEESMLTERMNHDWLIDASLLEAVRHGRLCVRDYRTRFPLKPDAPSVDVLLSIVSINDFREFVAELGYAVQVGDKSEGSAAQAAPAVPAAHAESVQAAPATGKVWTEERKAEAQAYRDQHGLKKTAEHFGVSQALISRHTKPKKKPITSHFAGLGGRPR